MGWPTWLKKKVIGGEKPIKKEKPLPRDTETDILRIHVIADYLRLIGMQVMVFMLDREEQEWVTVSGIVRDMSDNGQSLILTDVEILWADNHYSRQDIIQVDIKDFDMIKILDRRPRE